MSAPAADRGAPGGVAARVALHVFGPCDAARIDAFARVFTATFAAYMAFRFSEAREWLTDFGYHHDAATASCSKPLPLPTMPAALVVPAAVVVFGACAAVIAGWRQRAACAALAAWALYAQLVDEVSAYSLNKLYLAGFAILACSPAWAGGKLTSAWPLRVLQATLLVQYTTAATCKVIHGDWLEVADVLHAQLMGTYRTSLAAWLLRALPRESFAMMELVTLAFEALAPLLLVVRRLAPWAMIAGVVFHAFIALTMHNLVYFSAQMVTFYVLFLDPALLERLARLLSRT